MDKKVEIVILNYNNWNDTLKCIKSSLKINYSNYSIVLVDNASTDNSCELLIEAFPKLNIIKSTINGGYANGMNLGINYALKNGADYIVILNNDTIVTENFLNNLMITAYSKEKIGIVSPKVGYIGQEDTLYCGGGNFSKLKCTGVAEYQGKSFEKYATENREINFAEGCCLLVKREVFEKVGLFEEKFFMYFEDVEFSERVTKYFKIMFCSDAVIYHKSGAGKSWVDYSPLYYYYYTRNRMWLFSKKNILLKTYVLLFSLLNTINKYLILKIAFLISNQENKNKLKKSIEALAKGFKEGINLLLFSKYI